MYLKLPLLAAFVAALSGCATPESYETVPVVVETPQGPVTCQLYLRSQVVWDRAIDRPDSMGVTQADNYCIAEGQRRWQVDNARSSTIERWGVPLLRTCKIQEELS